MGIGGSNLCLSDSIRKPIFLSKKIFQFYKLARLNWSICCNTIGGQSPSCHLIDKIISRFKIKIISRNCSIFKSNTLFYICCSAWNLTLTNNFVSNFKRRSIINMSTTYHTRFRIMITNITNLHSSTYESHFRKILNIRTSILSIKLKLPNTRPNTCSGIRARNCTLNRASI